MKVLTGGIKIEWDEKGELPIKITRVADDGTEIIIQPSSDKQGLAICSKQSTCWTSKVINVGSPSSLKRFAGFTVQKKAWRVR